MQTIRRYSAHRILAGALMGSLFMGLAPTGFAASGLPQPPPAEAFAAYAKFRSMVISPDGQHLAFTYETEDNEVKLAIATSDLKRITAAFGFGKDIHVGEQFWANNDRLIMTAWKNEGYLDGSRSFSRQIAVNVDGSHRDQIFFSGSGPVRLLDRLEQDPRHVLATQSLWRNREAYIRLYQVDVESGAMDRVGGLPDATPETHIVDAAADNSGEVRFALELDTGDDEYDDLDDVRYLHYRTAAGEWHRFRLPAQRRGAWFSKLGFSPDNRTFYFRSNFDMASNDTIGVFGLDLETGEITLEFRRPDVDVLGGIYGPQGEVLGVEYHPGYPTVHYFDDQNAYVKLDRNLAAAFPGQVVRITSYTMDGKAAVIRVYSDRNPGSYYLYHDGKAQLLAKARPDLDPETLGHTDAFSVTARDGQKLFGYLTLPPNGPQKNLPMVVWVHGGPFGILDVWGFDNDVQMLASHGYAVLQVNYRGSGGYGQDFMRSGYRQWGRKMQDDVTDATLWAIQSGVADRDRVCIGGGSYGGYAALEGVVREPDLYRCTIGIAGVYSLPMMRKRGDYRQNPRAANVYLDRNLGVDEAVLERYSPAYNVDRIHAALLLIHGKKDVRVPYTQAKLLRDRLDEAGKHYEWLVRREGHGFTQYENRVDQYKLMLKFLRQTIGPDRSQVAQTASNP